MPCTPEGLQLPNNCLERGFDKCDADIFGKSSTSCTVMCNYVSPFIGRIDDTGADGLHLIAEIMTHGSNILHITQKFCCINKYPITCSCMRNCSNYAYVKIFRQLISHPLTEQGHQGLLDDHRGVVAWQCISIHLMNERH